MAKIEWEKYKGCKVMIGSPVCQEPEILKEFLLSLEELDKEGLEVKYCFVDDNKIEESTEILKNFSNRNENTILLDVNLEESLNQNYICDDYTHR